MTASGTDEQRDDRRPMRDGVVDGDDVWPSLSADDLEVIASIDRGIGASELAGARKPEVTERLIARFGGVALYSFAERIRHYRDLVGDIERGVANDDQLLTELGCRGVVERLMGDLPDELHARLYTELIGPLDQRFIAATIDDDGEYLRRRYSEPIRSEPWWWTRRPSYFRDPDDPS